MSPGRSGDPVAALTRGDPRVTWGSVAASHRHGGGGYGRGTAPGGGGGGGGGDASAPGDGSGGGAGAAAGTAQRWSGQRCGRSMPLTAPRLPDTASKKRSTNGPNARARSRRDIGRHRRVAHRHIRNAAGPTHARPSSATTISSVRWNGSEPYRSFASGDPAARNTRRTCTGSVESQCRQRRQSSHSSSYTTVRRGAPTAVGRGPACAGGAW